MGETGEIPLTDLRISPESRTQREAAEAKSSPEVVLLLAKKGQRKLKKDLVDSGGSAAIIVHPFCPDRYGFNHITQQKDSYTRYKQQLREVVQRYQAMSLPLILFEEDNVNVGSVLDNMGIHGRVFLVPTLEQTPNPTTGSLNDLAGRLHEIGLQRATVSGSYLWQNRPSHLPYNFRIQEKPRFAQNNQLQGCVGHTLGTLLDAGIKATPGFAAYRENV